MGLAFFGPLNVGHASVFPNFDFILTLKENFSLELIDLILDTFSHKSSHLPSFVFSFSDFVIFAVTS